MLIRIFIYFMLFLVVYHLTDTWILVFFRSQMGSSFMPQINEYLLYSLSKKFVDKL
jgi:hypothetical protein